MPIDPYEPINVQISNPCIKCGKEVGNNIFSHCDPCWKKVEEPVFKPKKLNLGCYNKKMYGFINVDIREDVHPDVVDDVFSLQTFQPNTVDLIYACHVLEHADFKEAKKALSRWFDLLKPGGKIRLAIPDIEKVCAAVLYFKDMTYLKSAFWGSQRHSFDHHKSGWTFDTIKEDLETAGFKDIRRYDWKKTEHSHIDDYSQSYIPHMDKENGQLISLNIEAIKPPKWNENDKI